MDTNNLLVEFGKLVFNFQFLWVVIATTVTMEVLKWTIFPKDMPSKWYPIHALWVASLFLILKSVFTSDWREFAANFIFTVMLVDVIYTFLGQYIIEGVVKLFKTTFKLDKIVEQSEKSDKIVESIKEDEDANKR